MTWLPAAPRAQLRGFTLIEVILAISLSIGLFASMLGFYRYAAEVRADVTEQMQRTHARRLVLDRMTEQFRAATAYPSAGLAVEGGIDNVTFVTAALPQPSVYNVPEHGVPPAPPQQDVHIVTYNLRTLENDSGPPTVEGLEVSVQKLLNAAVVSLVGMDDPTVEDDDEGEDEAEAAPQVPATLLSPYIRFLRFQYFDGTAWSDTWPNGELPRAVEVAIGFEALPEGLAPAEYPHELFRRVIHVHGARRQQAGSIIRGLGGPGGGQ